LNKLLGFKKKTLGKSVQRFYLAKYAQLLDAEIMRCGFIGAYFFLLNSI